MKIIVCMKQVPKDINCEFDVKTKTIVREKGNLETNILDMHALEEAVRIRERKSEGDVTVISMGPPSTENILKQAICIGADNAVLMTDKVFAGSDTLATSYILAKGIELIGKYDLILCGKQSVDGDTGQVGPSLAEKLGIPHVTNVCSIEEINQYNIICRRLTDYGYEIIRLALPALLTVTKEINKPRTPTLKGFARAKKTQVKIIKADDIGANAVYCGLEGSATRVIKTFLPVYSRECGILSGTAEEQARQLLDKLIINGSIVNIG